MIRGALALCAGIAIAACVATPMSLAAAPPPAPCAFDQVAMLPADFDPTSVSATPVAAGSVPAYVQNDLTAAFNLAPPFFQKQLCGLDGVFIAPGGDSWGFRNIADGKRYLALSRQLWTKKKAPSFSAYENAVVARLLNWSAPKHPAKPGDPSDAPAVTVLAALAHEYGHILFYDTFVNPRGSPPNYAAFCNGTFFSDFWASLPNTPNIWRTYGDIVGAHKAGGVQIEDSLNAVPKPGHVDLLGAGALLHRVFSLNGTKRWASLFAAFSPDEDFVETFKLFVLKNSKAPLNSLQIRIPILHVVMIEDIPGTCSQRPVLQKKLACFAQAICPGATGDPCGPVCAQGP